MVLTIRPSQWSAGWKNLNEGYLELSNMYCNNSTLNFLWRKSLHKIQLKVSAQKRNTQKKLVNSIPLNVLNADLAPAIAS